MEGTTEILIVAPHGPIINGEYLNDARTGIIAEKIQRELGCTAIINDRFVKPAAEAPRSRADFRLDLFRTDHGRKVSGYLDQIKGIVDQDGKTLVLWVHGISDKFAIERGMEHIEKGLFSGKPGELHALVGYGQGGDPKTGEENDSLTASRSSVEAFCEKLSSQGMTTIPTHPEASNYRGRDGKRLNQWFVRSGYGFERVESMQLEIGERGFRDSVENAKRCGEVVARALADFRSRRQNRSRAI